MFKLNEDMFDDVDAVIPAVEVPAVEVAPIPVAEVEPEGPEVGPDTGMASVIMSLIKDEYTAIEGYNAAVATAEENGFTELAGTFRSIANEEMIHVGELEEALKIVSPNVVNIEAGKVEAAEDMSNPDDSIEGLEKYIFGEEVESDTEEPLIEDIHEVEVEADGQKVEVKPEDDKLSIEIEKCVDCEDKEFELDDTVNPDGTLDWTVDSTIMDNMKAPEGVEEEEEAL